LQEADNNIEKEFRAGATKRAARERKILQDKHVEEMIMSLVPKKKGELPPAALAALAEVKGSQPMLGGGGKVKVPFRDIPRPFTAPISATGTPSRGRNSLKTSSTPKSSSKSTSSTKSTTKRAVGPSTKKTSSSGTTVKKFVRPGTTMPGSRS